MESTSRYVKVAVDVKGRVKVIVEDKVKQSAIPPGLFPRPLHQR
jgi:hypothetical protein